MTEHPTYIRALLLHGFRAYLEPKAFDFEAKRCIAVFAPNGYGKSSLVDGLEFAFSDVGTLKRLGLRTINNSAGFAALAHNLAGDKSIAPSVTLDFRCGSTTTSGSRSAIGAKRLDRRISEILNSQGEHTYIRAKAKLDRLIELQSDQLLAVATQHHTAALSA